MAEAEERARLEAEEAERKALAELERVEAEREAHEKEKSNAQVLSNDNNLQQHLFIEDLPLEEQFSESLSDDEYLDDYDDLSEEENLDDDLSDEEDLDDDLSDAENLDDDISDEENLDDDLREDEDLSCILPKEPSDAGTQH